MFGRLQPDGTASIQVFIKSRDVICG